MEPRTDSTGRGHPLEGIALISYPQSELGLKECSEDLPECMMQTEGLFSTCSLPRGGGALVQLALWIWRMVRFA